MKFLRFFLLSFCFIGCGGLFASTPANCSIEQDRMIMTSHSIMVLSPFEHEDHITAYNDYGTLLWDVKFNTKILAWKMKDGMLYAFSKARGLEQTYLHCINPNTGLVAWQRP